MCVCSNAEIILRHGVRLDTTTCMESTANAVLFCKYVTNCPACFNLRRGGAKMIGHLIVNEKDVEEMERVVRRKGMQVNQP